MEDFSIIELYWQRDERAIRESNQKYGSYCLMVAHKKTTFGVGEMGTFWFALHTVCLSAFPIQHKLIFLLLASRPYSLIRNQYKNRSFSFLLVKDKYFQLFYVFSLSTELLMYLLL